MSKEQVINVPIKPEVKRMLKKQADANGRATMREAQIIVEREVIRQAKKQ